MTKLLAPLLVAVFIVEVTKVSYADRLVHIVESTVQRNLPHTIGIVKGQSFLQNPRSSV